MGKWFIDQWKEIGKVGKVFSFQWKGTSDKNDMSLVTFFCHYGSGALLRHFCWGIGKYSPELEKCSE